MMQNIIDDLQEQMEKLQENRNPENLSAEDRISRLQNLLHKKDGEIAFLKDTVRVECEERMGLVAALTKLQRDVSMKSEKSNLDGVLPPSIGSRTNRPSSSGGDRQSPLAKVQLSPKDESIFKLFQQANAKNQKRLTSQTRKLF
jgi:hypothetical protein